MPFDPCPVEPTVKPARRIIERAIELIDRPGKWCKGGVGFTSDGKRCMLAALGSAAAEYALNTAERPVLWRDAVESAVEAVVGPIVKYNDDPRTTHAMVIAALRKTAERL